MNQGFQENRAWNCNWRATGTCEEVTRKGRVDQKIELELALARIGAIILRRKPLQYLFSLGEMGVFG